MARRFGLHLLSWAFKVTSQITSMHMTSDNKALRRCGGGILKTPGPEVRVSELRDARDGGEGDRGDASEGLP